MGGLYLQDHASEQTGVSSGYARLNHPSLRSTCRQRKCTCCIFSIVCGKVELGKHKHRCGNTTSDCVPRAGSPSGSPFSTAQLRLRSKVHAVGRAREHSSKEAFTVAVAARSIEYQDNRGKLLLHAREQKRIQHYMVLRAHRRAPSLHALGHRRSKWEPL